MFGAAASERADVMPSVQQYGDQTTADVACAACDKNVPVKHTKFYA